MVSLDQVRSQTSQVTKSRYSQPIQYFGVPVEAWNHPKSIANYILNIVKHTHSFGCQFIGPMGFGKSSLARCIAHHIHTIDPRYLVIWAGANDFQHLKRFLLSLPKQPMIIIFDDLTGALKQMGEKEIQKNFEDLTKIRWIIDEQTGEIPTIVFANYHYSKNMEKEFRAVLGMTVFLSFGAEEHTNIDTILPKKTIGRQNLEHFSKISDKMFTQNQFQLLHSNGQVITYKTDDPCRASCAVMGKESRIILTCKEDCCKKCSQTKTKKYADPKKIVEAARKAYKSFGVRAIKESLFKRGYTEVFSPQLKAACDFVENDILTKFDVRYDQLAEAVIEGDTDHRSRGYRKRRIENEELDELEQTAEVVEIEEKTNNEDQIKIPITEDKDNG
jgi:hypothetical protein